MVTGRPNPITPPSQRWFLPLFLGLSLPSLVHAQEWQRVIQLNGAAGAQLPTAPFVSNTKVYYAVASAGNALLTIQASKGVFRSTDGGATWNQAVDGIPGVVDSPLVGGRTWNGSDVVGLPDGTAFAVSDGRLYRSRDAGLT